MDGKTYPIASLYDMARIPVEAVDRFLAELPGILAEVRRVQQVKEIFDAQFDGLMKFRVEDAGKPSWTDDDLGETTISVRLPDGDTMKVSRPLSTPDTGRK